MAYPQATTEKPTKSLTGDAVNLNNRLEEISGRLIKLCGVLHGNEPRDARAEGGEEGPVVLSRSFDRAFAIISNIESELTRIEAKL